MCPVRMGSGTVAESWKSYLMSACPGLAERELIQHLADEKNGSSGRTRTYNPPVNSRMLCH